MLMATFSWLHLSDIHFGHGTTKYGIDQLVVLHRLVDNAAAQIASGAVGRPDCIIITGDIGNTGAGQDDSEYQRGLRWLTDLADRVGVPLDRLLFAPGNHDANRGVEMSARFPKRLLDALRYGACPIDEAIADAEEASILASRFANYRRLVDCLGGPAAGADSVTQFWEEELSLGEGLKLRIVSFNSSLLAAGDDDEARLQLGHQQIHSAFAADPDSGRITMMLTHHPFGWLSDGVVVDQYARTEGGIHLSGHLHAQEAEQSTRAGQNTLVRIAAGAVHGDESGNQQHAYNFGRLNVEDGWATVTIFPRVFDGAQFVRHAQLCDDDSSSATFPPFNKKKLVPLAPSPSGPGSALRRQSMVLLEDVADRRTAYPTDLSIGQLAERQLLIAPRLVGRDDSGAHNVASVAVQLMAANNCLVVGDPGAGKTVFTFLVHKQLLDDGNSPAPLPLSIVDFLIESDLSLTRLGQIVGLTSTELEEVSARIFIVDGVDEALAGGAGARATGSALERLSRLGTLLVTCRVREFEVDLMSHLNLGAFRIIAELQPWDFPQFTGYVYRLAAAGCLDDPEATLAWISTERALIELTERPLFARMLMLVAQHRVGEAPSDLSQLYSAYLRRLASWTEQRMARVGCDGHDVYGAWRDFAWHVFGERRLSADTMFGDVPAKFFSRAMVLECAYEVASGILDYVRARGELRSRFRHYTMYEFLVADRIANDLHAAAAGGSVSCSHLFERDLPREIRRHLTRLIDSESEALAELLANEFKALSAISEVPRRRTVGNLLAYYLGRVNVNRARVRQLLTNEKDIFLRNSLWWSLANLDDVEAVTSFIDEMVNEEKSTTASWNRGYLRYYYGDLQRDQADPPYTDDTAMSDWSRTRGMTLQMLSAEGYADEEPVARRALDVFTYLDLCGFHGDRLRDEEHERLAAVIEGVRRTAPDLAARLSVMMEDLR